MLLLAALALAQPDVDDLEAWEEILDHALHGPHGCYDVRGTVAWEHRGSGNHNIGKAGFLVRLDQHRFGDFTLLDPVTDVTGTPEFQTADLALQFRPLIGGGPGTRLHHSAEGVYLRDRNDSDTQRWVDAGTGTVWVQRDTDGVTTVHRAEALKERSDAPEANTVAYVLDGTEHAAFVYTGRDPHLQRGGLVQHRSRNAIYYRPDGLPQREVQDVSFRRLRLSRSSSGHEITYHSFTPCADGVAPPEAPAEVARAVVTPSSASIVPTLAAATDPRVATIEELRWKARMTRREAAYHSKWFAVQAGLLGLTAGYIALQDPDKRPGDVQLGLLGGASVLLTVYNIGRIGSTRSRAKQQERKADALQAKLEE